MLTAEIAEKYKKLRELRVLRGKFFFSGGSLMEPILSAVILAAGYGKRMKSNLPKVLHPLAGAPLILHSLRAVAAVTDELPVLVIGHGAELVRESLATLDTIGEHALYALQEEQMGTAHALSTAEPLLLGKDGLVLVITGDMPLLTSATFQRLVDAQRTNSGPLTMLTVILDDPHGFGRVVRGPDNSVREIVEEAQASPEILAIHELNASVYCFRADWLWPALARVPLSPKGEYYLTDLVGIAVGDGLRVEALTAADPREALGINTREHLAEAETVMRARINAGWMAAGVSIVDPASTYIDFQVEIGEDTLLYPGCCLQGQTRVGPGCRVGPNAVIRESRIGANCTIQSAWLENVDLPEGTQVDAYQRLHGAYDPTQAAKTRPGAGVE
jgi:bifunctional UDP-N-acetylglucosamine pyrophosphorylase/glucosamine-1-phosphate N-acetyltransferase